MFRNRLYYELKPYLPWRLRMALRRVSARRKLQTCQDVWPINETAARPPDGWPGWPNGKKFAFVITHDVEGPNGLAKCRDLMKLEAELGFRSSFNFIPEGDYIVPPELRAELTQNGFEVGVHDLHHDGKLYRSRQDFAEKAVWINRYLKDWGAVGFRSGFMFHNLDWLHDLNVLYDASTFDTDPFEPQSDGVNTIFPFWVPGPKFETRNSESENGNAQSSITNHQSPITSPSEVRPGYVELPYTLPQDSTLFLLLREKTINIWTRKLDWIAEHGGMALVNVHPDYVCFGNGRSDGHTFPLALYRQFLEYIRDRYTGAYWHPLPREIARWYRREVVEALTHDKPCGDMHGSTYQAQRPPCNLRGKRAAVVLYSYYPSDVRPRLEAEALAQAGMQVDFICLRENGQDPRQFVRGLDIWRLPLHMRRAGKIAYAVQYLWFLLLTFLVLAVRSFRHRYSLVHVHNMPDILVFSALIPRLRGAKVILDLHDPMPELLQSKYGLPEKGRSVRLLKWLEKASIGFADLAITPNIAFQKRFIARSCPPEKMHIVMNSPNEHIFNEQRCVSPSQTPSSVRRPFVLMYHGLLVERHGLDTALHAVSRVRHDIPEVRLHVYGERTPYVNDMQRLMKDLRLEDIVEYHGVRSVEEIAQIISTVDLGLVPNRRCAFTEINFPTRIFEYLAMGRPVIAPRTQGIRDYFGEDEILYFEPDSPEDLARVILQVRNHPEQTDAILRRGIEVYRRHLWTEEKRRFVSLVENLLENAQSGR